MKRKLSIYILRLLNEMDGIPLTGAALTNEVQTTYPEAMASEIKEAVDELSSAAWISGVRNKLTGQISWTITDTGKHQLHQL